MTPKLNTTRQRGLLVRGARMASLVVALFSLLHACSNQLGDGGSETNWVSSCDDDGDCTVGSCVCGVCSKSCTTSTACPGGGGPTVCAMGDSSSYRAVCGETSAVQGVCLRDCSTTGCGAGFRCEAGACVPAAASASVPDGAASPTGTIETHSLFTAGISFVGLGPEVPLMGRCLGGSLGGDLNDEWQCTIVEFPAEGNDCDCEAQGLETPSTDVLATARVYAGSYGYCGSDGTVACDSLCGCQAPRLSGADLEACRNDAEAVRPAGYCVVAPDRGLGSAAIVDKCSPDQRTVLRYFSGGRGGRTVMSCATTHSADVAAPRAGRDMGDPCTPADQYNADFSGFAASAITVDTGTAECASNVCLVTHFQGRTDCPYGQPEPPEKALKTCLASVSKTPVAIFVRPQKVDRPPEAAVYCSCRCDGPGPGPFCQCPTDFTCTPLLDGPAPGAVAGSYCVKTGTAVEDPSQVEDGKECNPGQPLPRPDGCGDP